MSNIPLEIVAEDDFVDYAFELGYLALKMEVPGWRNWPDRQVLLHDGYVFYIEFKRLGEEPRPGQYFRHKELRKMGYHVYVCDTFEDAIDMLEIELTRNQDYG